MGIPFYKWLYIQEFLDIYYEDLRVEKLLILVKIQRGYNYGTCMLTVLDDCIL